VIRWAALAALVAIWTSLAPRAQLDHIVVGIRSLDEGIAQFESLTGVQAGIGGKHPGRGTENALVSLGGGTYLEILAPQAGVPLSPQDQTLRGLDRLTIIDWAVSVPEVDRAVAALKSAGFTASPAKPGARLTPSGERLDWTTFGLRGADIDAAPFFIRWSPNTRHPSTTAPAGCELEALVVRDRASEKLATAMQALDVPHVTIATGALHIEAALTCGSKRATLTSQ
jgi:Glyoxalase-like domain